MRAAVGTAVVANKIVTAWGGEPVDATALIPERYRPPAARPRAKTESQRAHDTRSAVALMGSFLGDRNPLG